PGTPRAVYAETHEVAELIRGFVAAAAAAADPATAARRLAAACRGLGFYRRATSDGLRPVLGSYRTDTGARHGFSDEWRLPALSQPTARANVALGRAALELARATGDPGAWEFACRLTERSLEFLPDADPIDPRPS